ncbi:GGDEF domain-containing phosphodiesterase [Larsenimonas rhizosphaerae]|uniref:GGDEF domain-containing phosphodiesterase n=1 Tax=Larsenimonas rhizosphaerae TaxID=2944682 RepID=UPI002033EBF3|nr:GGDEF domain-containing phosphodiesterase [Larsenimonas rhizosphaerae]MCM2130024.1 EAL domain-containing protein [Larsenimonas rhizosphaerae]
MADMCTPESNGEEKSREIEILDQAIGTLDAWVRNRVGTNDLTLDGQRAESECVARLAVLCNALYPQVTPSPMPFGALSGGCFSEHTLLLGGVLDGTTDGIWEWRLDTDQLCLSSRWFSMLGLKEEHGPLPSSVWLDRVHPDDQAMLREAVERYLNSIDSSLAVEYRIKDAFGTWRMMACRGVSDGQTSGRGRWLVGTQTDITDQRFCDRATGLGNAELLNQHLDDICRSNSDQPLYLIKLALSNAEDVLDAFPPHHIEGGLRRLSRVMRCRLPPDTSLVALPNYQFGLVVEADSRATLSDIMDRLEAVFSEPVIFDETGVWLSHAMGIVEFHPGQVTNVPQLLMQARLALQHAVRTGVGSRCFYTDALAELTRHAGAGEQMIREALAHNGVRCFLQPIVSLSEGGRIVGFEALMRLQTEFGIIGPEYFIEVAERTALIHPLSRHLLEQAIDVLADPRFNTVYGSEFTVNVNLSSKQLLDATLVEWLMSALARRNVAPTRLQVEVTESSVLAEPQTARLTLEALRARGISIALDDFGTGYSSLAQLCDLPLDTVKLDRCLVMHIESDARKRHVLVSMIELCKRLGYRVVVEGVEDFPVLRTVRALGGDSIQGFIYARPLPVGRVIEELPLFPVMKA